MLRSVQCDNGNQHNRGDAYCQLITFTKAMYIFNVVSEFCQILSISGNCDKCTAINYLLKASFATVYRAYLNLSNLLFGILMIVCFYIYMISQSTYFNQIKPCICTMNLRALRCHSLYVQCVVLVIQSSVARKRYNA